MDKRLLIPHRLRRFTHARIEVNGVDSRYILGESTHVYARDLLVLHVVSSYRAPLANLAVVCVAAGAFLLLSWAGFSSLRITAWLALAAASALAVLAVSRRIAARMAWRLERFGFVCLGALVGVAFYLVGFRVLPDHWTSIVILLGLEAIAILPALFIPLLRARPIATRMGTAGAITGVVAITWYVVAFAGMARDYASFASGTPAAELLASRRMARAQRLERWTDGPIAVSLSGGGYRAAAVHAGILSVFEDAGLPTDQPEVLENPSVHVS